MPFFFYAAELSELDFYAERCYQQDLYRSVWNRLERVSEVKSGLSGDDFLQRLQHKKEHPASLEQHLDWLRQAGFDATCLHLHLNRAFLAAVKKK